MKQIQYQGLYFYYLDLLLFTVFVLSIVLYRLLYFASFDFFFLGNNSYNEILKFSGTQEYVAVFFISFIRFDKILTILTISLHLILNVIYANVHTERDGKIQVQFFFSSQIACFIFLESFFSWFIDRFYGFGDAQPHHRKRNYYILIECFNW